MEKASTVLLIGDVEELREPPHVISQLIDMVLGEDQNLLAQQEQRWAHLKICVSCQAFLGSYLLKAIEYDKAHDIPSQGTQQLLSKLTQLMHGTLAEDMPAYIEALENRGEAEANKLFTQFVDHLRSCRECQLEVQDLRSWLH